MSHPPGRRRHSLVVLLVLLLLPTASLAAQTPIRITVFDVGQAEMAALETPDSQWILFDAGRAGQDAPDLLRGLGLRAVALAVGSHRHADHIGGMPEVLVEFPVGLYVGDTARTEFRSINTTMLRRRLGQKRIPIRDPGADTIAVDSLRLILLPQRPKDLEKENNNSVVVRLEYGRFSMLLPGDAEEAEQQWLLACCARLLDVNVLEAAHHGADNGESRGWLAAVSPALVIISAGVNDSYRHPNPQAVADYEQATTGRVFCTNRHGTITILAWPDGRSEVTTERHSKKSCRYDGTAYDDPP